MLGIFGRVFLGGAGEGRALGVEPPWGDLGVWALGRCPYLLLIFCVP